MFEGLDLDVNPGDIIQILGPNGSGQPSLLRVLSCLSNDYRGHYLWQDPPVRQSRFELCSHMLYLGHAAGVKKALTPRENLNWYLGLSHHQSGMSIEEALAEVNLAGFEDVPCYQLSAGQLRRVALSRMYLTPAPLWILDEPFTAIDKAGVARLERLIADHALSGGMVLITTHQDMTLANVRPLDLKGYEPVIQDEWAHDDDAEESPYA